MVEAWGLASIVLSVVVVDVSPARCSLINEGNYVCEMAISLLMSYTCIRLKIVFTFLSSLQVLTMLNLIFLYYIEVDCNIIII